LHFEESQYERSIALPDNADIDQAKASFRKEMLWITIPKKAGTGSQSKN
jgi:HSP20 family protein